MKKCYLITLIGLLMLPLVLGIDFCEDIMSPGDIPCLVVTSYPSTCSTYNMSIYFLNSSDTPELLDSRIMGSYGLTGQCNITFDYSTLGNYYLNSTIDTASIIIKSEDEMASLTVMGFIVGITLVFFYLGLKFDFSKSEVANFIIKRCFILLGMFLVSLDTGMIATISTNAGLGVEREIFRYLWIINWSIYFFMMVLFWNTIQKSLGLWKDIANRRRMGE